MTQVEIRKTISIAELAIQLKEDCIEKINKKLNSSGGETNQKPERK